MIFLILNVKASSLPSPGLMIVPQGGEGGGGGHMGMIMQPDQPNSLGNGSIIVRKWRGRER